ncbi:Phytochrome-like protein cph2 [Marinomonas spartinae]|uniref:bifunctional diguanylate cyclase/phosphodiesterase n=1 Tax=Marinomonas spartinae TaxID=1792290 RepID=UPI000808DE61|nr:EAL domain-containing protein [Marinomonas spartinae]SBS30508.1 Phytochrome-like protein cph2 [Marinomonas spartinae]
MTRQLVETRQITSQEAEQCANEQIQIIGSIQPHGFQIVVDSKDHRIVQYSDNISRLIKEVSHAKINDRALLGSHLFKWLTFKEREKLDSLPTKYTVALPLTDDSVIKGSQWECVAHVSHGWICLEFTPKIPESINSSTLISQLDDMVALLKVVHDEAELFQTITAQLQSYTQYDRVMMYRFHPDWSGEVVAESVSEQESVKFLGLRFPAEDIPKQARELYKLNMIRYFANVLDTPAKLVPSILPNGEPLDQSVSSLRNMSNVHRSYLKNMGVKASLSLSIIEEDKLWGMVVFHHNTSKVPSQRVISQLRITSKLFGEIINSYLTPSFNIKELTFLMNTQSYIEAVFSQAKKADLSHSLFETILEKVNSIIHYDFIGIIYDKKCYSLKQNTFSILEQATSDALAQIFTDADMLHYESSQLYNDIGAIPGLEDMYGLSIMRTQSPIDFYVFIGRREVSKTIQWGGVPGTVDIVLKDNKRQLEPRSSFALWCQQVEGQSKEWQPRDTKFLQCFFNESKEFISLKRTQLLMNKLEKGAYYDTLTGLANRAYLKSFIENLDPNSDISFVSFFFIDLDNFKDVNDFMGHETGDKLLISISQRLNACVRPNDLVVRLSGDEFIILFAHQTPPELDLIHQLADKVASRIGEPVLDSAHTLVITSSIGIVTQSTKDIDFNETLKRADIAMYAAKNAGKNRHHIFNSKDQDSFNKRTILTMDLREHTASGDITLYYQVKVGANKQLKGAEALARWNHPTFGFISPEVFITLAEKNNLIYALGLNIIDKACSDLAYWRNISPNFDLGGPLSINISPTQLAELAFEEDLFAILERHKIDKKWICLEITESVFMKNYTVSIEALVRLRKKGITISLDDFGTGYSSLNSLWKLPIDEVKIDKSFISTMSQDRNLFTMVESIIQLCQKLNLQVVGEGIESSIEFNLLKGLGCDAMQGYYFSKPLDPETFQRNYIQI